MKYKMVKYFTDFQCSVFEEIKKMALNDEIKKEYQQNSEDAIKNDVFGAPSYVFNNEIFWGQDRLDYLEEALKSKQT